MDTYGPYHDIKSRTAEELHIHCNDRKVMQQRASRLNRDVNRLVEEVLAIRDISITFPYLPSDSTKAERMAARRVMEIGDVIRVLRDKTEELCNFNRVAWSDAGREKNRLENN
jgi:hypothetical protein|tara:strand:- start:1340 stop:1678 length:339 start_codon:yes stop_codon:yes gene_type:complete